MSLSFKQAWRLGKNEEIRAVRVPLPSGTMYLCAILDVFGRNVLAWNLSNTMDVMLMLFPLTTALAQYGAPEISGSDQGSQFTTSDWFSMVEGLGNPYQHGWQGPRL